MLRPPPRALKRVGERARERGSVFNFDFPIQSAQNCATETSANDVRGKTDASFASTTGKVKVSLQSARMCRLDSEREMELERQTHTGIWRRAEGFQP